MKAVAPSPKAESRPKPKSAPKPAQLKPELLPALAKPSVPHLPAFVRTGLGPAQAPAQPSVSATSTSALTSSIDKLPDPPLKPPRSVVPYRKQSISPAGHAMPPQVQETIENSLGVSLDGVQIHADSNAQTAAEIFSARAFTYGNHIFLGKNETLGDVRLIAHEAAHVVQQQGVPTIHRWAPAQSDAFEREADRASSAVLGGERFTVSERVSKPRVQRSVLSRLLDKVADWAYNIPGFRLLTIIIGKNPINWENVDRSAANILRGLVELIPGGHQIEKALDKYGVFDKVGGWLEQQVKRMASIGSAIKQDWDAFVDDLGWTDIRHPGKVLDDALGVFKRAITRIADFASDVARDILKFIKDAILMPLAKLAQGTRGWDLLIAVLGKNPITGEPVPRTADTLIGGFMKLIGEEEVWNNIKKANAVSRAWTWFQSVLTGLLGFVTQIPSLFIQALKSLTIEDILILPNAFIKVGKVFGNFILNFISWAGEKVWTLLQIIFEVVAPAAMPYLKKVGAAFRTILKHPIAFVSNLVRAGKLGFQQFADHFGTHLKESFLEWLTGSLPGVYIPKALEIREIIKFVLSVLGLTWENIRGKLVKVVGETAVKAMETGFDIVLTLVREGPAAAWEKIKDEISNLQDMVVKGIMDFIVETVVKKAVAKVLSLLVPGGAFIQAIISIYDTIMVFIDKLAKIIQVAKAFLDSMMDIASGAISGAAKKVESTLAGLLTLAISFLAGFLGLGKIADRVLAIIQKIRDPIDKALDKVIDWIVTMVKKAASAVVSGAKSVGQAVLGWLGFRAPFTTVDGKSHSLHFETRNNEVQLIRASDLPTEVMAYLDTLTFDAGDPKAGQLNQAKLLVPQIRLLTRTPTSGTTATTPQQESDIIRLVTRLSELLMNLVDVDISQLPPNADWSQKAKSNTQHYCKVFLLSSTTAKGGSAAFGNSPEYDFSVGGGWVRMHLIPYSVGGKGDDTNWIPAPSNINSGGPVRSFETALETSVRSAAVPSTGGMRPRGTKAPQPNVAWMEAEVTGFRPPIADKKGRNLYFPAGVGLKFGIYRSDGAAWLKLDAPVSSQNVSIPPAPDNKIRLSSASGTQMSASGLDHLSGRGYSNRLIDLIKETRQAGFPSYQVLKARLLAATENSKLMTPQDIDTIVAYFEGHDDIYLK